MKIFALGLALSCYVPLSAQSDTVVSKVYTWNSLKAEKKDGSETKQIAEGSGAALAYMN